MARLRDLRRGLALERPPRRIRWTAAPADDDAGSAASAALSSRWRQVRAYESCPSEITTASSFGRRMLWYGASSGTLPHMVDILRHSASSGALPHVVGRPQLHARAHRSRIPPNPPHTRRADPSRARRKRERLLPAFARSDDKKTVIRDVIRDVIGT